jgi:magnesium-transporting ATPase (P-type)
MGSSYRESMPINCLVMLLNLWQVDKSHENGVFTSYIKGAPERVLAKCSTYLHDGVMQPVTDEFKQTYDTAYNVSPTFSRFNS